MLTISSTASASTSDGLLKHVPADSQIVIGMDVPKIKDSFVFKEVLQLLQSQSSASPAVQFVIDAGGFDLEKDVNALLMAFDKAPTNPNNPVAPAGVTVLQGKFDRAAVEKAAAAKFGELKPRKVGSLDLKVGKDFSIAFLDANTILVGSDDAYS
ncbi:MAG TPA: hypothetical protein VLA12_09310, partial [Planctomycetaceae bacterium]|nr:hypothetical protein [Planctomycetaceae bacterium]